MIYSTKSVKINKIKEDIKDQYLNATDTVFDGAYYNENGEIIDISDLCEDEIDTSGNKTGNVLINLDKDPNRLNYTVGLEESTIKEVSSSTNNGTTNNENTNSGTTNTGSTTEDTSSNTISPLISCKVCASSAS